MSKCEAPLRLINLGGIYDNFAYTSGKKYKKNLLWIKQNMYWIWRYCTNDTSTIRECIQSIIIYL